jgi:hypothetical protein
MGEPDHSGVPNPAPAATRPCPRGRNAYPDAGRPAIRGIPALAEDPLSRPSVKAGLAIWRRSMAGSRKEIGL